MIFVIFMIVVGIILGGTGLYFLFKERNDKDSIKVYGVMSLIGIVIVIINIFKL